MIEGIKFKAINGAVTDISTENIFDLCERLRGNTVLAPNRGDMRMAASIIESLMEMIGEPKIEDDIWEKIPF